MHPLPGDRAVVTIAAPGSGVAVEPPTWVGVASGAAEDSAEGNAGGTAGNATDAAQRAAPTADVEHLDAAPEAGSTGQDDSLSDSANREANALREIYLRETDAHVQTLRAFIAEQRWRSEPHRLSEAAYRACHTLSGSSKMAEARHGIRLAEPLDRWLRRGWNSGAGLLTADLGLLEDCMEAMCQVARHPDETTAYFIDHDVLRERIDAAEADLEHRIALAAAAAAASAANESAASMPQVPSPVATLVATEPSSADESGESDEAFDPDIASIFTEEAAELLETIEGALQGWAGARHDVAALDALKRPLHTLKGGARMAGIRSMGDLSHELETAIGHIELGLVAPDDHALAALQAGVDELARMRDRVAQGQYPPPARALLARLQMLLSGGVEGPVVAADRCDGLDRRADGRAGPPADASADTNFGTNADATVPRRRVRDLATEASGDAEGHAVAARHRGRHHRRDRADRVSVLARGRYRRGSLRAAVGAGAAGARRRLASLAVPCRGREPVAQGDRPEMARVDAELLDQLLNNAGEVSIGRARLEQQVGSIDHNLGELSRTVTRLKEQLRNLEIETEKQILHRYEGESARRDDFDPLELDRYSSIQQFSRALAETASDVGSIQQLLEMQTQNTQNLLQQQARTSPSCRTA